MTTTPLVFPQKTGHLFLRQLPPCNSLPPSLVTLDQSHKKPKAGGDGSEDCPVTGNREGEGWLGTKKRSAPIGTDPMFFCSAVIIQQRGKRMCHMHMYHKHMYQHIPLLLQRRCRYRSMNPARSSDRKKRKIQLQQLRTKMLTFSFLFVFLKLVKQLIAY